MAGKFETCHTLRARDRGTNHKSPAEQQ